MLWNVVFHLFCLFCLYLLAGRNICALGADARTVAYIHDFIQSGPSDPVIRIPAYCTSPMYTVSITGRDGTKPVHVYTSTNDIVSNGGDICLGGNSCSDEDEPQALADMMTAANHWASFDYGDGVASLTITTTCGGLERENIEDLPGQPTVNRDNLVHPNRASMWNPEYVDAHTFKIDLHPPTGAHWPRQLYLKLPGRCHEKHPLFIFANPMAKQEEIDPAHPGCPADADDPHYTILGSTGRQTDIDPGGALDSAVTPNDQLELTLDNSWNGHTFCIPGGAYVKGRIFIDGAVNVTIRGRGILSGERFRHFDSGTWNGSQLIFAASADHADPNNNGQNLSIEGITLIDAGRSNIESEKNVTVDNVKILSWHVNTDGISGTNGTRIKDVFLKVNDDAIKFTHSHNTVTQVIAWQQVAGSVVQMSWNSFTPHENSHLDKLIVIGADRGGRPGAHNLNASVFSIRNMMAGGIKNFTFTDVKTEVAPYSLMTLQLEDDLTYADSRRQHDCMGPGYAFYTCDDLDSNGRVEHLRFTNITITGPPSRISIIDKNFDNEYDFTSALYPGNNPFYDLPDTIAHIVFDNVMVDGKIVVDQSPLDHQVHWQDVLEFPSGMITGFTAAAGRAPHSPSNLTVH